MYFVLPESIMIIFIHKNRYIAIIAESIRQSPNLIIPVGSYRKIF